MSGAGTLPGTLPLQGPGFPRWIRAIRLHSQDELLISVMALPPLPALKDAGVLFYAQGIRVSVSKGPVLMPSCVAVNEFALYSALSTPAEPRALHPSQAYTDAAIASAPSAGASTPRCLSSQTKPGLWSSRHNQTSILSLESLKACSPGVLGDEYAATGALDKAE